MAIQNRTKLDVTWKISYNILKEKQMWTLFSFEGNVTWTDLWTMGKIWIDENEWIGHGEEREGCVWKYCVWHPNWMRE